MGKKRIITIIFLSVLVIGLTILVFSNKTLSFDYASFNFIHNISENEYQRFFTIISDYGITLGFLISIVVIFLKLPKVIILESCINIFTIECINFITKLTFKRIRPEWSIIAIRGYSYPSAHTMIATIVYGYFIFLSSKFVKNRCLKYCIYAICITMIFLIGLSRVYLGVHYASDVIAGYLLSIIYLLIITSLKKSILKKRK